MNNKLLSQIFSNVKYCKIHHGKQIGTLLDNGLIKLTCGCTTKADRKWYTDKFGNKHAFNLPVPGTKLDLKRGYVYENTVELHHKTKEEMGSQKWAEIQKAS